MDDTNEEYEVTPEEEEEMAETFRMWMEMWAKTEDWNVDHDS